MILQIFFNFLRPKIIQEICKFEDYKEVVFLSFYCYHVINGNVIQLILDIPGILGATKYQRIVGNPC